MWSRYPVVRGMLAYSILYPGANILQQTAFRHNVHEQKYTSEHVHRNFFTKLKVVDWAEVSRFMIYGSLFHAPLVHNWMRLIGTLFPGTATKTVLKKVFCF